MHYLSLVFALFFLIASHGLTAMGTSTSPFNAIKRMLDKTDRYMRQKAAASLSTDTILTPTPTITATLQPTPGSTINQQVNEIATKIENSQDSTKIIIKRVEIACKGCDILTLIEQLCQQKKIKIDKIYIDADLSNQINVMAKLTLAEKKRESTDNENNHMIIELKESLKKTKFKGKL